MSFRFRRSLRIAPGIRLNLSPRGISTTFGAGGLSVNTGRRGTYLDAGIPGTGVHARSRIGGTTGGASGAGTGLAGCAGCGGLGFLLLIVLIGIGSSLSNPGGSSIGDSGSSYTPPTATESSYTAAQQRETLYAHAKVNVRTGAGTSYAVARTLARGDRIEVDRADARGWAPAYDTYGQRIGYVYRAGTRLRPYEPESRPEPTSTRGAPSGASAICRDGSYSFSAHRRGTCSHHGGVAQWL
jgi:hypothetical protein